MVKEAPTGSSSGPARTLELSLQERLWIFGSFFGADTVCVIGKTPVAWDTVIKTAVNASCAELTSAEQKKLKTALKKALTGAPVPAKGSLDSVIDELAGQAEARAKAEYKVSQKGDRPSKIRILARLNAGLSTALDATLSISYFDKKIAEVHKPECETLALLSRQVKDQAQGHQVLEVFTTGEDNRRRASLLTAGQKTVLEELNETLLGFGPAAVHWPIDTLSGATFLVSCLPSAKTPTYKKVYLLHPVVEGREYDSMFNPALRALGRELLSRRLVHPTVEEMFAMLADIAHDEGALVVFANANCLSTGAKTNTVVQNDTNASHLPLKPYLTGLSKRDCSQAPAALFLASNCPNIVHPANPTPRVRAFCSALKDSTTQLRDKGWHNTLRSAHEKEHDEGGNRSFQEFFRQWETFCEARKVPSFFRQGNRLKVSYFWYVNQTSQEVWDRSIVMRAAAASHAFNMGFADSTLGLEYLLGDMQDRDDIVTYVRDVETQLSLLDDDHRRSIRHIAAAKYWAREPAILDIYKRQRPRQPDQAMATDDLVRKGLEGDGLINEKVSASGEKQFRATLDVKAIVLDHWRKEIAQNPASKDKDDWRLLFRLAAKDMKDDVERDRDSALELPTNSYIGNDLLVWPEVFRKLIRSVEYACVPEDDDRSSKYLAEFDETALKAELDYDDPRDVFRACFKKIFIEKFRGGLTPGHTWFSADDRADTTAAEMLQLVSKDMYLGAPHEWLDEDLHQDYYRACAAVLHSIGYTSDAQECLSNVVGGKAKSLFMTDSFSTDELTTFLHDLCAEGGVTLTCPFPMWSEFEPENELLFLSILFLGLKCRHYEPDDIEEALVDFLSSEKLVSDDIEPRFAHKVNWAWSRARTHDGRVLVIRLLALFHERKAEAAMQCRAATIAKIEALDQDPNSAAAFDQDLSEDLKRAGDLHYHHLVKAQVILNSGVHRLSELNHQNERMRLMVARQRIERFLSEVASPREQRAALYRSENKLNEMMRRALDFGCAYDVYLDILLESAKTLKSDNRPLRAYAAYARPALEIAQGIEYSGHAVRAANIAKELLADIKRVRAESLGADGATGDGWDKLVTEDVKTQATVEWGHGMPVKRSLLDDEMLDIIPRQVDKDAPVIGFLLPQVHELIETFRDFDTAIEAQTAFVDGVAKAPIA